MGSVRNLLISGSLVVLSGCASVGQSPDGATTDADKLAANKAVVQRVFDEFYNARNVETMTEYMDEHHVQHNPNEGNGTKALADYFTTQFWSLPGDVDAHIQRIIAEGDLVVTQAHWAPIGQEDNPWVGVATADIYRIVDGKLVEHWDVVQPVPEGPSVNGNTMFDGGTFQPEPAAVVEANKKIVLRYMEEVINQRQFDVLDEIMVADWKAHNPGEPNGREALKDYFRAMVKQLPEIHADVKRIVAEGNLVVTQSHYTVKAGDRGNDFAEGSGAAFDFFRLQDGKIVEHWDVLQRPVPTTSANGNSMFDGAELYNYR